jgi:ParB-like chromosome segregation protein Spo0J
MQVIVEDWPVKKLKPAPDNPKKHPRRNIERIKASIKEYGWTVPILARPDGEILAGHGRRLAALELEIETVPVIPLELSDEQAALLRIADNRAAEAPWDHQALERTLREIGAVDALERLRLDFDDKLADLDAVEMVDAPPKALEIEHKKATIASQIQRLPDEALDAEIVVIAPQGGTEALVITDDDLSDLAREVRNRARNGEPVAIEIARRFFPMKAVRK